ncbi:MULTISPECIES: M20 family metallopeptidase [Micrococcaceae]|uniref:M20 family metallopeptidase n=1 Tax=unclassified Kocuria TaxID=2649579 RepID=UPI001011E7CD|nr:MULTISPECIES: M20 family metallopeptidase [unclassified Kocuria]
MGKNVSDIFAGLAEQLNWQEELYKDLHRNPELGLKEHRTSERLQKELGDLGLEPKVIGGTGVVAVIENGDGPIIMARADIDALPVSERTGLDYASKNDGVMHACGHDMHMATLLGAVRILVQNKDAWSGTYVALFQPSEENAKGASAMIDDGLVDKVPHPEVVLGQHVMPKPAGHVYTHSGPMLSMADSIHITVHGRGSHGSMPHLSVDPVVLAASIVLRLQSIVSREVEPGEFAVVTVGAFNSGKQANVIPDRAELRLNIRTYDHDVRNRVIASIERIVRGECQAAGSPEDPEFEYYDQFPLTENDADVTDRLSRAFTSGFDEGVLQTGSPATASEDFSELPDAFGVPYCYWFFGGADEKKYADAVKNGRLQEDIPANHSPFFYPVIHPTIETGTRAQVLAALEYLVP